MNPPRSTKTLMITGASSGIGKSFLALADNEFASVFTLGRTPIRAGQPNHHHEFLDLKLPVATQLNQENLPPAIDVLVLCAGADFKGRTEFLENAFPIWEETIQVNFLRPLELIHLILPRVLASEMKTIVAITSMNIDLPPAGCLAYTAAKTALRATLDNLRLEYAAVGLRVIEICPSITRTNFALNRTGSQEKAEAFYRGFPEILSPEDVAQAILWAVRQPPGTSISKLELQPTTLAK